MAVRATPIRAADRPRPLAEKWPAMPRISKEDAKQMETDQPQLLDSVAGEGRKRACTARVSVEVALVRLASAESLKGLNAAAVALSQNHQSVDRAAARTVGKILR